MFLDCKGREDFLAISEGGQRLLQEVEDCPKPIVSAIMGSCLGGGLEVCL